MSRIEPGFFVQHSAWLPWRRLSPRTQEIVRRFESSLIHFTLLRILGLFVSSSSKGVKPHDTVGHQQTLLDPAQFGAAKSAEQLPQRWGPKMGTSPYVLPNVSCIGNILFCSFGRGMDMGKKHQSMFRQALPARSFFCVKLHLKAVRCTRSF